MFYSTFWGLYSEIKKTLSGKGGRRRAPAPSSAAGTDSGASPGVRLNVVSGISSLNYALGLIGEPLVNKNSSVLITVPVNKGASEIKKEISFIAEKNRNDGPNLIVFMKAGRYVKNIIGALKDSGRDDFKNGSLNVYLIEKSKLVEGFIGEEMSLGKGENFNYFSILIMVFS